MENQELIAKAKAHLGKFKPCDASPLSPDDFPRVRVRATAMVCFERDERKERVCVFLDQTTGEFVSMMYAVEEPGAICSETWRWHDD